MPRIVRSAIVQIATPDPPRDPVALRDVLVDLHAARVEQAGQMGVQVLGFRQGFSLPWFAVGDDRQWSSLAERIDGPTVRRMQELAQRHRMVLVVPFYEIARTVCYDSAAVIDADGTIRGVARRLHLDLPDQRYFRPGDGDSPVFETAAGRIGVCIGLDRHFPEVLRILALDGADIVYLPAAAQQGEEVAWNLEPQAAAISNGYFVVAPNRSGHETLDRTRHYCGQSYIADPRGQVLARASRDHSDLIWAELDTSVLERWRDESHRMQMRRPEIYGRIGRR